MPNLPDKGLFVASPLTLQIVPVPELFGSDASGVPAGAQEAWAAAANGVPVLVWASGAQAPSGASASYSATTKAVTITWTNPAGPVKADSFDVKRADGSLVGSVTAPALTIVDDDPRPLTGSYTVTARLAGGSSTAVATNSLSLAANPGAVTGTFTTPSRGWAVAWSAPSYGAPDGYNVYGNGVLLVSVAGNVTGWTHKWVPAGTSITYEVRAVLAGVEGGRSSVTKVTGSGKATGVAANVSGNYGEDEYWLTVSWTAPAYGAVDQYQIFQDSTLVATALAGTTGVTLRPDAGRCHTYTVRSVYNNVGSYDAAIAKCVPTSYVLPPPGQSCPVLFSHAGGAGTIQLNWRAPGSPVTSYTIEVYRVSGPVLEATVTTAGTLLPDGSLYVTIAGLISGSHTTRIRANSDGGSSAWRTTGTYDPTAVSTEAMCTIL